MKRIYISTDIQNLAEQYRDNLFSDRRRNFRYPIYLLEELYQQIKIKKYKDYVKNIIEYFDEILVLHPDKFEYYKNQYFSLSDRELASKRWKPRADKSFADAIVEAMRYDDVRKYEIPSYVKKLEIKSCVYCNAQYTATVHKDNDMIVGAYQIDHFKPKSLYPFLCISFFNLQPCCANCNLWKSDMPIEFNLYTTNASEIDPFNFLLTKKSIINYMLYQDATKLNIQLNSSNNNLLTNHNTRFHTQELYVNFNDDAEELLWKCKIYNNTYKELLLHQFVKLFPNKKQDIHRFLFGFYDKVADIHKRPLTKMKQDIYKQLSPLFKL